MNKQVNIKIDGLTVDQDAVAKNRKRILNLGLLGGKYFTIGASEVYPKFDDVKRENEMNASLDFMPNRTPRRFQVRDYDVYAQALSTSPDGTTKVVFNPGSAEEAKATVIDGNANFGTTSDEAIAQALSGKKTIFVNGVKLVEKANEYNQAEVDRLNVFIKQLQQMRDSLISTIRDNEKRANAYEKEILDSTPKQQMNGMGSPTIVIAPAEEDGIN